MSSVARRTAQHAFQDLGVAPAASRPKRRNRHLQLVIDLVPRGMRSLAGESRTATWITIGILAVFGLLLVRPMIMSLLSWHRTANVLADRRTEVASLERRNESLRDKRDFYRTDAFIAERARHYGLVRPGETSFVVRELVHPESVGRYATTQLLNAVASDPDDAVGGGAAPAG